MSHPEAFDAMVAAWNERDPARVRAHLDRALADLWRYEWKVWNGDRLVSAGMDVARLNAQGQIERIDGFFGPLPANA